MGLGCGLEYSKNRRKTAYLDKNTPNVLEIPLFHRCYALKKIQVPYFVEVVTQRSTRSGEQLLTAERADRGPTSIIVTWPKAPLTTMTGP